MIGLQILIIFVGGKAFSVTKLDGRGWGYSIAFGFLSIPVGAAIRCIPDELVRRLIPDYFIRRANRPTLQLEDEEGQFQFPQPLADVKEELSFLRKMKGGRINNLRFRVEQAKESFRARSRSGSRSRDNSNPPTPNGERAEGDVMPPPSPDSRARARGRSRSNSALAATVMMAGIVGGSVGAGWSPIERQPGSDQGWGRPETRVDLEQQSGVEVHPGTAKDAKLTVEQSGQDNVPPSQREDIGPQRIADNGPSVKDAQDDEYKHLA